MILPRMEQADVPLSVNPQQVQVRWLIEPGFEVNLFAGKERQGTRLVDLQAPLAAVVLRPDPNDQLARQRAWGRRRAVNDH